MIASDRSSEGISVAFRRQARSTLIHFQSLIQAKKRGMELAPADYVAAVQGYCAGGIPDYQMSAFLMAVCWQGMTDDEAAALTDAMVRSGESWDFSDLPGPKVDKHSTGGVGDKVSLALAPLAAACGCIVPMISGRGLGHTGGTLDKLDSIPGMRTELGHDEFRKILGRLGVAVGGQTRNLVPADRKLYALRDATCTIDNPSLITASILSKKIAGGAEALVIDIKVGSGAFLPDLETARALADLLARVARRAGLTFKALLTNMQQPVGCTVGNALEVREALDTLRGEGPSDLRELVLELAAEMLVAGGIDGDRDAGRSRATMVLDAGSALERFGDLVDLQGGDRQIVEEPQRLPSSPDQEVLRAPRAGIVGAIDARRAADAALLLGAGRRVKEDVIDPGAGLELHAKLGDQLGAGDAWATLHFSPGAPVGDAAGFLSDALVLIDKPSPPAPLILERIV